MSKTFLSEQARAYYVRDHLPEGGLFAGANWRIATQPFTLSSKLVSELESLGGYLLDFYRACNVMYRHSVQGKLPSWIAKYLDAGKPRELVELSRANRFKGSLPRVIRPDVLLTDENFVITELDSVPGGIGLNAWLSETYSALGYEVVGGPDGMVDGFRGILKEGMGERRAAIVVSEESSVYRPEMEWIAGKIDCEVLSPMEIEDYLRKPSGLKPVFYRFFELFDLPNLPETKLLMQQAEHGKVTITPPLKPQLEEKMLFAFLWNTQLKQFWREFLGEKGISTLQKVVPYTWVIDSTSLPPHAEIPQLEIHSWDEMASFSQRQRELVLKISGFHEHAWGSRGVYVGHDLSSNQWQQAIEQATAEFSIHPYVLQKFKKSKRIKGNFFNFDLDDIDAFDARVRLCPYYFVGGDNSVKLGGILATICPADKKLLHGMADAVLAPCCVDTNSN